MQRTLKIPGLPRWLTDNRVIVQNAASMVGTTGLNSALGFLYWWLAARVFSPAAVGLASAGVSAMMLLGVLGTLGLGTALIGELPKRRGDATRLMSTALLTAGIASALLGVVFALVTPYLSPDLTPYAAGAASVALFAFGVALTSVTQVLDDALIGVYRGHYQLWRNAFFVIVKLVLLYGAAKWLASRHGLTIYATWTVGNLLSLAFVLWLAPRAVRGLKNYKPEWGWMRGLSRSALSHYFLNIALQVPGLALPVVVAVMLSTSLNAAFYMAWMVLTFLLVTPRALATVLYAVGSDNPRRLSEKSRLTMKLSLAVGIPAAVFLFVAAGPILHVFGKSYANDAQTSLRILSLAIVASTVKTHFVAQVRVERQTMRMVPVMALAAAIEVGAAALGARLGGLEGLSLGWLVVVYVEAAFMWPRVHRMLKGVPELRVPEPDRDLATQAEAFEVLTVEENLPR